MYKELDVFITGCQNTVDYWYDDGCIIASDMLAKFSQKDWEDLSSHVLMKPLEWQRKLAYCLDSSCNEHELNILLSLLDTDDEELFVICVDTLRSYTTLEAKQMIRDNPAMLVRVNELLPRAGVATRGVLEDFLVKMHG
ncbi:hypothetical protein HPY31_18770 [Brevibacillus sp. HB1.3]|uniref:hypothetical protein n=1 Tax=Brevibacillus sp. HB1.3 TaxID=2738842 RepID=UPI0015561B4E|nr:hypothetical protein [Brevibacillus sp. HB1.3]NQF15942.1 hypothetical protein [Brevibacillus sp. HB1.3]